jgi:TolA-binding protein
MSTYDLQLDALGKASRRAAMVSVFALVIVLASLAYGSYRLRHDIAQLQTTKTGLQKDVVELQSQLRNLQDSVKSLKYTQITPQNEVFQFQATANPKPGVARS